VYYGPPTEGLVARLKFCRMFSVGTAARAPRGGPQGIGAGFGLIGLEAGRLSRDDAGGLAGRLPGELPGGPRGTGLRNTVG
jgi:hypothetical protein